MTKAAVLAPAQLAALVRAIFAKHGVSHVYASPLFQAASHSVHGYDVCDFSRLNPEVGDEADLEKLAQALLKFRLAARPDATSDGDVNGHRVRLSQTSALFSAQPSSRRPAV